EQVATQRAATSAELGSDVYIVDAETGELLWSLKNRASEAYALVDSVPGDIRVLDMDNNGELDRLYFADTGGNIWRVDLVSAFDNSSGNVAFSQQTKLTHFAALGEGTADGDQRKFFYEPDTALRLSNGVPVMTLSIGSGYRTHPLDIGDNDHFFVLREKDANVFKAPESNDSYYPITHSDLMESSVLRQTGESILQQTDKKGWFYPLAHHGEKVLASSMTFLDKVLFTTFAVADESGNDVVVEACAPGTTTSRAYVLDLLTSQPVANLDREETVSGSGETLVSNDDFMVAGFNEILDAPQLIFSELTSADGGACEVGDCQQSVSVRIGKLNIPLLDLDNTLNTQDANYSEMVDLTRLLPRLYWRDDGVDGSSKVEGATPQ
ncbi:MAG: hypothetical protein R3E89_18140, partial [Thiolinea sp.]